MFFNRHYILCNLIFFLQLCEEVEQAFEVHCWVPASLGEIELKRFLLQLSEANASPQLPVHFSLGISLLTIASQQNTLKLGKMK